MTKRIPSACLTASTAPLFVCFVLLTFSPELLPSQERSNVWAPDNPFTEAETATRQFFDSIKHDPLLLAAFLREMPKGGDLHNHLGGAIYAETYLEWLMESNGCLDTTTMSAVPCDRSDAAVGAVEILRDPIVYRRVVDAWSTRNVELGHESGHDQFFDTFGRFGFAGAGRNAEMLSEARKNAARDRLLYLELMRTLDDGRVVRLTAQNDWDDDLSEMRSQLLEGGLRDSLRLALAELSDVESVADSLLCESEQDYATTAQACSVEVRYLYQVLRGLPPRFVFAQILAGYELAEMDSRIVGFNLVMPEDYPVPLRDFDLHMQIIDFLRPLYSNARISLHAGELAPGLVPPAELCCHIRNSIELGHAERIGHGIDVAYEDDPFDLLDLMNERDVTVEICLTSNDVILGVTGEYHPLGLYMDHGINTCLATDDEGVSRIDLTHEFAKGVLEQGLDYSDLKRMARTSLEKSFLPGESIWQDFDAYRLSPQLSGQLRASTLNRNARQLLAGSERAQLQWELERQFIAFERDWKNRLDRTVKRSTPSE